MDVPMLEDFEVELVWGASSAAQEDPERYRESTGGLVDVELELFRAAWTAAQANLESYRNSTAPVQEKEWELEREVEVARRELWSWQRSGPMLWEYQRITGFQETNPNAVAHHVVSMYGPPCKACGKPLRSPRAKFCAACPD